MDNDSNDNIENRYRRNLTTYFRVRAKLKIIVLENSTNDQLDW
jgi:hypothetical protein